MGHWGVKSYEVDEADSALDAGFDGVHGAAYEDLMDDRNPLSVDQVQKRLANPETLAAAVASHHLHHHSADPSRCFGVTSPLWDWVFHTRRRHRIVVTREAKPGVSSRPGDAVVGG